MARVFVYHGYLVCESSWRLGVEGLWVKGDAFAWVSGWRSIRHASGYSGLMGSSFYAVGTGAVKSTHQTDVRRSKVTEFVFA